jgi:hypothetical protein
MQCTRGLRWRRCSRISAAMAGSSNVALRSLCGARISPSAGMTRIRFDGLAFASQPGRVRQAPHEIAAQLVARGSTLFKGAATPAGPREVNHAL